MSVPEPVPEITAEVLLFWSEPNESIGTNHLSDQAVLQPLEIPCTPLPVTAEVEGSSPVVPAIYSK
jgi:hypothetical protein